MRLTSRYYNSLWCWPVLYKYLSNKNTQNFQLINAGKNAWRYNYIFISRLLLPYPHFTSITGFVLFTAILLQIASGFYLACYYLPEPGLVVELREEMFLETRYGFEIYSTHVRGVDVLFVCSYWHIIKKIYLRNFVGSETDGWMLGGYAFLFFHYIVGLGICLSASHLSDLTFTIAANIYWSLFDNLHKTYYVIFTNKHLNADQLIRLMILHYISPVYYLTLVQLHIFYCHESWDTGSNFNTHESKKLSYVTWFYDAFSKEFGDAWFNIIVFFSYFWHHSFYAFPNNYFFFEHWNTYEVEDINFFQVAPHWYFRPLMGLLVVSPTHYEGLMWLGGFFLLLSIMPMLHKWYSGSERITYELPWSVFMLHVLLFFIFTFSLFTTASILPCGRYYYDPECGYGGNIFIKFSYQYVYFYLGWLIYNVELIESWLFKNFTHRSDISQLRWQTKLELHLQFTWRDPGLIAMWIEVDESFYKKLFTKFSTKWRYKLEKHDRYFDSLRKEFILVRIIRKHLLLRYFTDSFEINVYDTTKMDIIIDKFNIKHRYYAFLKYFSYLNARYWRGIKFYEEPYFFNLLRHRYWYTIIMYSKISITNFDAFFIYTNFKWVRRLKKRIKVFTSNLIAPKPQRPEIIW